MQVVHGAIYARQALAQRSDTVEVFARRGSILDRNGNVLVRSMPSESVYAVPREIVDPDATAAKLQRIFGKLDPATVAALHDKHLWFVWIARKVPHDEVERVRALNLLGIALKEEETGLRVDPAGASRRPCSASSAPTKTGSTASNIRKTRAARPVRAA